MKLYCRFMLVLFYDSTKGWLLLKLCLRRIVITNTKTDIITSTSFLLPYIHAQATKPFNRIRKEKKIRSISPLFGTQQVEWTSTNHKRMSPVESPNFAGTLQVLLSKPTSSSLTVPLRLPFQAAESCLRHTVNGPQRRSEAQYLVLGICGI